MELWLKNGFNTTQCIPRCTEKLYNMKHTDGDNNLNNHTKMCRELRDQKRAENDKKAKDRIEEEKTIKPKNIYTLLMEEGPKNEENEREKLTIKEVQKDIK